MLRFLAFVIGVVFLVVGILGFVPETAPGGYLFGVFHVNALHNVVHIVTGLISIWVGSVSWLACKRFFQIFGVIYLLVAILGFFYGDEPIFGLLSNNRADTWLHLGLGVVIFYLGFGRFGVTKRK